MTTKAEGKSEDPIRSDWDQEDDDWEDWGDAEAEPRSNNTDVREDKSESSNNNTTQGITKASCRDENSNRSTDDKSSWGLWGGRLTSVLSTASEGLGNITSTVNQGLNQIIGVPDPEEMARLNTVEETKYKKTESIKQPVPVAVESEVEQQSLQAAPVFGLNLVSGVTTLGSKVLNTGLDTLEGIGKKTMNILQENDPKLMNKRKLLGLESEKPNLSDVLKEAKKDADQLELTLKELQLEKRRVQLSFEFLFENQCGLVHLEALDILSRESKLKLQTLQDSVSGKALAELQETLNEVKELLEFEDLECENEGDYDAQQINEILLATIADADLQINFDDIVKSWSTALEWLNSNSAVEADVEESFAKGITTLSETCALEVCKLHKIAELLLVKEHHSTANEVDCIVQLCKQFNGHLQGVTQRFAANINSKVSDEAKERTSTLFTEMLVALHHIEKSFQLFVPILQIGAV